MKLPEYSKRLAAFIVIIIPSLLLSNGGGIFMSSTLSSGNIVLVNNKDILLEKENLYVSIDHNFADVKVKYIFRNRGKKQKIMYGFPVSYRALVGEDEPKDGSKNESPDNISEFKMKFNGADVAVEKLNREYQMQELYSIDENSFNSTGNRWYAASLDFPEGESTLNVSYKIENIWQDDLPSSKGGFRNYSNREFVYILSPSGSWGNGVVKEFSVTLDFTKAALDKMTLVSIEGLKLKPKDNVYSATFTDFKMAEAKPFVVTYRLSREDTRSYYLNCGIFENFSASSSLKGFEIDNAFECESSSAWVDGSGKGGVGEWVEFSSNWIQGIFIANGMISSKELYYKYSRIKRLRLDITWSDGSVTSEEKELEDRRYPENGVVDEDFYDNLMFFTGEGIIPTKARITILDVYPGTEYKKVCISGVFLVQFRGD